MIQEEFPVEGGGEQSLTIDFESVISLLFLSLGGKCGISIYNVYTNTALHTLRIIIRTKVFSYYEKDKFQTSFVAK